MSHQRERLASFLKKELSVFLLRSFPRDPEVFLSIDSVVLNSSAESAEIYVSVFPESGGAAVFKELKLYGKEARKFIASKLKRRKIPRINFLPADTEKTAHLEKLLEKVKNEDNAAR